MAGRRQYGSGTVFQRADGRWIARTEAGWTANGSRRRITMTAATEKEVRAKLRAKQREIAANGLPAAQPKTLTVKAWADLWLPLHVREVRPQSYNASRSAVQQWIVPTIGTKRLATLTPGDVRTLVNAVRDAGRSDATATRTRSVLMGMLRRAHEEGHEVPSRVLDMRHRQQKDRATKQRVALADEDIVATLRSAAGAPGGVRFAVALLQGLRPSEVRGLTWDAIDFDRGIIHVDWQLQPLPYLDKTDRAKGFRVPDQYEARHLTHAYHLTRPKTQAGIRRPPMLDNVAEALHRWKAMTPDNPWGLVFATTTKRGDVMPVRDDLDRDQWRDLLARAGVNHVYDLYEARHSVATLLLEAGVDHYIVTAIMGHTNIDTTRIYQHAQAKVIKAELERATSDVVSRALVTD